MGIKLQDDVLTNVDKFIKEVNSHLTNLKYKDIKIVLKRLLDITSADNFYRFLDGKGDYPDLFFMPSELAIKQKIYSSYKKEYTETLGRARYELIDIALEKYRKDNPDIEKEFYLMLMLLNHLFVKALLSFGSFKDLPNLYKIFTSNLDYMVTTFKDIDLSNDLSLRSILLPVKYFNREANTIGYNSQRVDVDNISLALDFSDSGANDKSDLCLSVFNILEDGKDMPEVSKVKFIELSTVYICSIMHLSNNVVSVCNECEELYMDFKSEEQNICSECYNEKHRLNKILIYRR